jgi:eukaryotic-like serine/threonine-protein kinase
VQLRVELLAQESSPPGFAYIPAGSFASGGDPQAIDPSLAQTLELEAFWIARRELTNAEWAEFVNDPETQARSAEAARSLYIPREQNGTPIPAANWGGPDTPVMGISWNEARDYLSWRNRRAQERGERWRYDLPSEAQWEKAARGVDGRHFPWGNRFDFCLVVGLYSKAQALFAAPGGLEVGDESPYGVQDLAGLRQEWTREPRLVDPSAPPAYAVRGGCWIHPRDTFFRSGSRNWQDASVGGGRMGLRLVARELR